MPKPVKIIKCRIELQPELATRLVDARTDLSCRCNVVGRRFIDVLAVCAVKDCPRPDSKLAFGLIFQPALSDTTP